MNGQRVLRLKIISSPPAFATMDSLVASYSGSKLQDQSLTEVEQDDLGDGNDRLSLQFAMPPVAQVRQ